MNIYTETKNKLRSVSAVIALLFVILLLNGASSAQGQAQKPKGGVELKGRAPVSKEILQVKLPKAQEATLKNGLRVVLLENHKVPTVSMQMVVLSGGLSDPANQRGLATFTASLLREGTKTRTSRQIAEQVDALGATLGANSGLSAFTTNVSTTGLVENLDGMLDIFADVILNPAFPKEEVEKFKTRQLSQLQAQRAIPQFLAAERFQRAIYGEHPGALVSASAESIRAMTPESLAVFHAQNFLPNNAILAIVGDVTMKEIMPKLESEFGSWKAGKAVNTTIANVPKQGAAKIYLIDRPGSVQTVLQLGALGIERTSPDYFGMLVMNRIFGGGPSGRLFMNLREDKGYTYGAYSSFGGSKFPGTILASSEVRTDVTEGAMKEFMYEINRIRNEKVSAADLDNAKRALIGSFALSLEQPQALLQNIITQKLYDLPDDYWDTYPKKVMAVTADDVQNTAKKYLDTEHLQVVAVGDASKVRSSLEKYGTVEVFDVEGKSVSIP
ncbi:MAG TPA: pitrilysin family protein [Pyrinomonadaceae bacterium]|jgi:predicted Zn-dependent peptidase